MKATLQFNLPEDQSEFNAALKGADALGALFDVRQEVFRPARKHGYSDPNLTLLLTSINTLIENAADHSGWPRDEYGQLMVAEDIIYLLERRFTTILENHNLTSEDI